MPGSSYSGTLPASTPELRKLGVRLREHVTVLPANIGSRSLDRPEKLDAAREYLAAKLKPLETPVSLLKFEDVGAQGGKAKNLIFELVGKAPERIVVVGAHYDSIA